MILCDICNKWFHWYVCMTYYCISYISVYSLNRGCVDVISEPVEEYWNCVNCKD